MLSEKKRVAKDSSKKDAPISETQSVRERRHDLRRFMKKSRVLRFQEKINNVIEWRKRSNRFLEEHKSEVENP